ncbi:RT0821/Lpp0805 family surface protein [Azospirillum canadense]|uniref:RT0821/Lpp0805 family surface protein n=1 Tax=Azospirillum canadense TaxID=403962 RepID=UPI0022270F31|nr:RT0821/Lpp0805 family surface protein [Azospirillum canadense]MCW2243296.1 surface antigen [Azospirillum canadense]
MTIQPPFHKQAIRKSAICVVVALSLGACQTGSTSETVGTLGGAAGGALIGSQFGGGAGKLATTAIGTLVGAFAGREIARRLDTNSESRAMAAERDAAARNQTITWNNPQNNSRGSVRPMRTYENASGQTCRDYTHTINVEGKRETARGTACKQSDGTWQLVS